MSKERDIVALLRAGPLPFRDLMHGRSASFQLAYLRLLQNGTIEESGMGTKADPKYVGLPGMAYPERRLSVRRADVNTLVRSGIPREEAKSQLANASEKGMEAVLALLEDAHLRIIDRGEGLAFRDRVEKPKNRPSAKVVGMVLREMKRTV
jgi:hypothetical protein